MVTREPAPKSYAGRRVAFVAIVVLWTAVGQEFAEGGWRAWFGQEIMSIPAHYFYLAGTILLLAPYLLATPRWSLVAALKKMRLWRWLAIAWLALVVALLVAILTAAPNPFADWRNLALTALVAALAGRWLHAQPWSRKALTDLAVGYGIVSAVHLGLFVAGGGASVLGVRTPVFYGPLLYMAIFSSITLIYSWTVFSQAKFSAIESFLVRFGAVSSSILVILSFRRSFWMAWAVGMSSVAYLWFRSRTKNPKGALTLGVLLIAGMVVAFTAIGTDNIATRLESFLPGADNEFAATNEDHVNDLVDAWRVIVAEPVFGYGIGRLYPTELIAEWKTESFEVHNAVLHVWLKYGLLGAIAYVGFHIGWVRAAWSAGKHLGLGVLTAVAVYLAAEMTATMVGTWPYGSTHMSVFHGILLACTAVAITKPGRSLAGTPAEAFTPA